MIRSLLRDLYRTDVILNGVDKARGCGGHSLVGAGEHVGAEVDERAIKIRETLKHFQREVASTAADIEHRTSGRSGSSGAAGDQIEREGGVDRRGLPGLQIGKAFYVAIKPVADFFYGCLSCSVHEYADDLIVMPSYIAGQ